MSGNPLLEGIAPGERRNVEIEVTQSYVGSAIRLPATIIRGAQKGPTLTICAAVHGDEINGTGVVRALAIDEDLKIESGVLILLPVVNIPGFERHSRYMPDRRDLNRCFPGSADGSFSVRYAHAVFSKIVKVSDYLIDLHTAAVRRTNYPNARANMEDPAVRNLTRWLGCEINVNSKGPHGSLRRAASESGHPTVLLECGEVWKIEPAIVEYGVSAVKNVLSHLEMSSTCPVTRRAFQIRVARTKWIRAEVGGMLQFHVAPGEIIEAGQPIASNTNLLGVEQNVLISPLGGVVIGMTTLPFVTPGDPVCHIGVVREDFGRLRESLEGKKGGLVERLRDDLATSIEVVKPDEQ